MSLVAWHGPHMFYGRCTTLREELGMACVCMSDACMLKLLLLGVSLFKYWRVPLGRESAWIEHDLSMSMCLA